MNRFQPVERYEDALTSWKDVIATSIIAAIGVNLLVSGIVLRLDKNYSIALILSGLIMCYGIAVIYILKRIRNLKTSHTFYGFLIYDREERDIVWVPRYEIDEHLWLHMMSVNSHNKEIQEAWKANQVADYKTRYDGKLYVEREENESDRILLELLEYCVLDTLSVQLHGYFSRFNLGEIKTLKRDEMQDILKSNRFLDWFSEDNSEALNAYDEIIWGNHSDQERLSLLKELPSPKPFALFEMVLPKDGTISRQKDGILIDHPLFSLQISISFTGSSALMPAGFEKWYLRIDNSHERYGEFSFSVKCTVAFKLRFFFSKNRIAVSRWIDSLSARMDEYISESTFFEKIAWNTAATVLESMNNTNVQTS